MNLGLTVAVVALFSSLLFPTHITGDNTIAVIEVPIAQKIISAAEHHGIDEEKFLKTAECESTLNVNAVGDGGNSFGLFQIHLPSHPTVTKEQALNPDFSIQWSAEKFKRDPTIWTCYQKLYGRD